MNMIDKIILYCKNLLKKTKKIQMLEATIEIYNESKNNKFKKTLKDIIRSKFSDEDVQKIKMKLKSFK